jgi:hypothetical protein
MKAGWGWWLPAAALAASMEALMGSGLFILRFSDLMINDLN